MEPNQQNTYKPKINISYQNQDQHPIQQKPIQQMTMQKPIQQMTMQMPIQQQMKMTMQMPIQQQMKMNMQLPIQQMPINNYEFNSNIEVMPDEIYHQQPFDSEEIRLLKEKQQGKKVVAVIVSFCSGGSYDQLFTRVQQKSAEGTQVLVYSCGANAIKKFITALSGHPESETLKQMMEYIKQLDHDCVVFNWECCSFYTSKTFPQGKNQLFKFLKMIMDKGYMAMFSDFSLKALINQWPADCELGPNPFKQTGQTSQHFELHFASEDLRNSPSAQLQTVGDMAQGGKCNVQAMGGTIVYTVDKKQLKHEKYQLKVLTVANHKVKQQNLKCKVGNFEGTAGHVLLSFKSGGHILTSMGHWMELMKIDTTDKKLFQIAERDYGIQYANQMRQEYSQLDAVSQKAYVSKNAVNFVQNQAPCSNMSKKSYYK